MIRLVFVALLTTFSVQLLSAQGLKSKPDGMIIKDLSQFKVDWNEETIVNRGDENWRIEATSQSTGPAGKVHQALEIWINGELVYTQVELKDSYNGRAVARKTYDLPRERGSYHVIIKCGSKQRTQDTCSLWVVQLQKYTSPAPPQAPATKPDAKNQYWMLMEPMEYVIGNTDVSITVPAGFVHDFASIPQALHSFGLSPHGLYSRAAIIHDWLYWSQGCSPEQSNRIMVLAMKESGVSTALALSMYAVLDIAGGAAWKQNKTERENGLPRIIPEDLRKLPPNKTWPDYRDELFKSGVRDLVAPKAVYCAYGNSFDVPGGIAPPSSVEPKIQSITTLTILN